MLDHSELLRLILLLICLVFSALFSSAETAFFSLQKIRLTHMIQTDVHRADRVAGMIRKPERLLATVLFGNNLVNTAAAALGTTIAISLFRDPNAAVIIATVTITILLMVAGEIIPKTIAANSPERLTLLLIKPLEIIEIIFYPVIKVLQFISFGISNVFGAQGHSFTITEEEIRSVISAGKATGSVDYHEADMLERVFHFGDRPVREVMTPRTEMVWIDRDILFEEFLTTYLEETHTRFPVYQDTIDNVVGFLSVKDILRALAEKNLRPKDKIIKLLRTPYFVPETKPIGELFLELREKGKQLAIIIDEFGGVAGLATIKQLMEVIVGPLGEEGERIEEEYQVIDEHTYQVEGGISIQEINIKLFLDLPSGEYETIAGFILDRLGHIPHTGEILLFQQLELTVEEMKGVKIEQIQIRRIVQSELEESQ